MLTLTPFGAVITPDAPDDTAWLSITAEPSQLAEWTKSWPCGGLRFCENGDCCEPREPDEHLAGL